MAAQPRSAEKSPEARPFVSAPDARRFFPAGAIEEARRRLFDVIDRQQGPALVCSAAGLGKSLLLAVLAEQFATKMSVATLAGGQLCTRRAMLQTILFQLDCPYRGLDEGELRLSIVAHLTGHANPDATKASTPQRLLLMVDEADALPLRLLEELRGLTNIADAGAPLVSLVLAGGSQLEERFAEPGLDAFSQRVAARCYLSPLGRDETHQYVRSQVAAVGADPEALFTTAALDALYAASDGIPRIINQLGDQLVWAAQQSADPTDVAPLDAADVQRAWAEIQQLPAPWHVVSPTTDRESSATSDDASCVVEFGPLEADAFDEPDICDAAETLDSQISESTETLELSYDDFESETASDDEPPASIPIGAAAAFTFHATEVENDVTSDPFAEDFDDEEFVLDRYAAFESHLLSAAPHVYNRLDVAFAADVGEAASTAVPAPDEPPKKQPVAASPALASEDSFPDDFDTEIDVEPEPQTAATISAPLGKSTGDLLVVDDDGRPAVEVVPSRHFRRLFSQLETASQLESAAVRR